MKKNQLPVLFIGRFQPLHLGHIDALKQVFEKEDFVIIGIGSAEDDYVPENPFTAGERYQMIEAALFDLVVDGKKITRERFTIVPLRNIHHYSLWVRHIETLLPPFGKIYTGSPIVDGLFKTDGGHTVVPIEKHRDVSATKIRKLMRENKIWEKFLPPPIVKLMKKFDGEKRLKTL